MLRTGLTMTAAIALLAETGCGDAATAAAAGAPGGGTLAATVSAAAAAPAGDAAAQTIEIVDRTGFDRPMQVGQITVPAGWRAEGGVNWDGSTQCATNQMKFQWRAVAPDGVEAIELLPGYGWQAPAAYIQMNPCPVEQIASPRDFLAMVARSMRPGSQIIAYRDRADLTGQVQASDRNGYRTQVGELRISYAVRGVPVEEVLTSAISFGQSGGTTGYVIGYRAAAGRLDMARADRLRGSFRGNMQYAQAIGQRGTASINRFSQAQSAAISAWHNRRMAEINAKGAADRAAIRTRGNAETNAIYAQTAADTSATNDRMYDSNLRALKEEQTWTNPTTGQTVQGSIHGGERVLQMGDGSFARTDDPYYNPAGSTEYQPQ